MDTVVNGHDRRAADGRGQDVVRRVVDVWTLAVEHQGHVNLFAKRIVGRGLAHNPEIRSELRGHAQIRLAAQQDVLGVPIDAGELTQEIADVGPDPEVVELPRVDRDSHREAL